MRKTYHHTSTFGPGPARPLNRRERDLWRARIEAARRSGDLTDGQWQVATTLLRMLGQDGRLDPSHQTLAAFSGESVSTVQRALKRLEEMGLLQWTRRIVRRRGAVAWQVEQTSNAYELLSPAVFSCIGQTEARIHKRSLSLTVLEQDAVDRLNAQRQIALLLAPNGCPP